MVALPGLEQQLLGNVQSRIDRFDRVRDRLVWRAVGGHAQLPNVLLGVPLHAIERVFLGLLRASVARPEDCVWV